MILYPLYPPDCFGADFDDELLSTCPDDSTGPTGRILAKHLPEISAEGLQKLQ